MAIIGDDYPKVGKTWNPNVRKLDFACATSDNKNLLAFAIRGYGKYIISNLDPTRIFEVRKISGINKFWNDIDLLKKAGINTSENIIKLSQPVEACEAKEALAQLGYETRKDIADEFPQFDKNILDEICQRYNIK